MGYFYLLTVENSNFFYFSAIDASDAKTNETSSSVDSQLKDSSNSFRRRHSSEGVEAKFDHGSTLPKEPPLKCADISSSEIIDSWTWGSRPKEEKLRECLQLICQEQQKMCGDASGTTLYSYRFRQRTTVLKR